MHAVLAAPKIAIKDCTGANSGDQASIAFHTDAVQLLVEMLEHGMAH